MISYFPPVTTYQSLRPELLTKKKGSGEWGHKLGQILEKIVKAHREEI